MTIIETQRLKLREFNLGDCTALEAVLCDSHVMRFSDGVLSAEQTRSWVRDMIEDRYPAWGFGMWAVVERKTSEVIGYCGLSRFSDRCTDEGAELGFRFARPYWGCGYATEAAEAVRDHRFNVLQLPRIVALIDPANSSAVRVARKIGMRYDRDIMLAGYTHPDSVYAVEQSMGE